MRKEQEDIALDAQKRGHLSSLIVRLPDFYGPHADNSLANPIFRAALAGKTANWLGPIQTPHEFVFVPDTGPVIVELASRKDCYGEAWNYGGPGEITGGEFIQKIYRAAGQEPKFRSAGRTMLRILGWFNPLMKELVEMAYLQETPVILDDSRLAETRSGAQNDVRQGHSPHPRMDAQRNLIFCSEKEGELRASRCIHSSAGAVVPG